MFVAQVHASLFADVMVASAPEAMVRAGLEIQAVLRQPAD